ncbi:GNAT family N-acetyltransferase [Clostridium nigeriense]|uniref:GNAT family N-acetyltransferase n=1 Tax=Clostridium nigeriense TaxID=1805470 RepID=UPI0008346167|nr:GNAT family protein [Clostridium nigeriense]
MGKFNENVESAHIYYCIGRAWWNKGIVSEAFYAVIKYLIEEVGVNRIEARHDTRNIYSGKVMEKCGLKFEGILREAGKNNIGICDEAWYGLLRKDYF